MKNEIIVALTGASGAIYFKQTVLSLLEADDIYLYLVASSTGVQVFKYELKEDLSEFIASLDQDRVCYESNSNLFSYLASGSSQISAMVITPCSMGTVAKISNGISDSLLLRAADCMIKEKKRLVLSIRETPLSSIHLTNMLKLTVENVVIYPLVISYYNYPSDLAQAIEYVVKRQNKYLTDKLDQKLIWNRH